jgi:hypothetical protein
MTETFFVRFEEVDPPHVRFHVAGHLRSRSEPFPLDARFVIRVLFDAYSAMERSSFPGADQPVDASEVRRLVEKHPRRNILVHSMTEPCISSVKYISAFAADFVTEVNVATRGVEEREDGTYETATFSVCLRDVHLLFHCVRGFHWVSTIARSMSAEPGADSR